MEETCNTFKIQRISFLHLPAEIREIIYTHTFQATYLTPKPQTQTPYNNHSTSTHALQRQQSPLHLPLPSNASLLLTCRLVNAETTPHFWANATLDLRSTPLKSATSFLRQDSFNPSPHPHLQLRALEILLVHLLPYQGFQGDLVGALQSLASRGRAVKTVRVRATTSGPGPGPGPTSDPSRGSSDALPREQTPSHLQVELALWHFFSVWMQVGRKCGVEEFQLVRRFPPSFGARDLRAYVDGVVGRLRVKGKVDVFVGLEGEMSVVVRVEEG